MIPKENISSRTKMHEEGEVTRVAYGTIGAEANTRGSCTIGDAIHAGSGMASVPEDQRPTLYAALCPWFKRLRTQQLLHGWSYLEFSKTWRRGHKLVFRKQALNHTTRGGRQLQGGPKIG